MAEPKELIASAGYGASVDSAFLLAVHPEDRFRPDGMPQVDRRTYVLKLEGGKASFLETVPAPLIHAWRSSSGTAYCAPIRGGYVYLHREGKWEKETFSEKDESPRFVWGFGGKDPTEDIVYLCATEALFVRQSGSWKRFAAPRGSKDLVHVHGLNPSEVYVCAEAKFLLWNGKKLAAIEGPEESNPETVLVVSEQEILAGSNFLFRWTEDGGWNLLKTPIKGYYTFLKLEEAVYAANSGAGVVKITDGRPELVTGQFRCIRLFSLGNGILAVGKDTGYLFDGKTWAKAQLPMCVKGGLPK